MILSCEADSTFNKHVKKKKIPRSLNFVRDFSLKLMCPKHAKYSLFDQSLHQIRPNVLVNGSEQSYPTAAGVDTRKSNRSERSQITVIARGMRSVEKWI